MPDTRELDLLLEGLRHAYGPDAYRATREPGWWISRCPLHSHHPGRALLIHEDEEDHTVTAACLDGCDQERAMARLQRFADFYVREPAARRKRELETRPASDFRLRDGDRASIDADLKAIAAPVYFERLTDAEVPEHGGTIRCPLPDHDDRTPSCRVYAEPGRGWTCWGCHAGGTIYDLAAAMWGMGTRGSDFLELQRLLAALFLGRVPESRSFHERAAA